MVRYFNSGKNGNNANNSAHHSNRLLQRLLKVCLWSSLFLLTACTGGSGESTVAQQGSNAQQLPDEPTTQAATAVNYNGPDPRDQAVRDYKLFFWDEVTQPTIGCAGCHMQEGSGTRWFVRSDNINTAYDDTLPVVSLADPASSSLVDKVAGGHNCWVADLTLCRDTLIEFITNWANGAADTSATELVLVAPNDQLPSGAITFPDNASLFSTTVYPLLTANCAACHSDTVPVAQQQTPLFAHSNVDTAYEAAKTKIDVEVIEDSRLVVRLRDEAHNCWDVCADNAAEMQAQIDALLPDTADPVDPALVTSMALRMEDDGIQASSGGRVETHVIAQYEFRLGEGNRIDDRSNVAPLMPLTLIGDYTWQKNWGVTFNDGRAQASVNNSTKLFDELSGTGEYTIETWIFPGNVTQDNTARIVSYSGGTEARNFTLGQSLYNYEALNRSSVTNTNGLPALVTADADEDAQAVLQHVVVTFHPETGRKIYVNGVDTNDPDDQGGGNFYNWDRDFAFVIGNEVSGNRPWQGTMRFLAIHKRALSPEDIQINYDAGVGQKYYLLFRLATLNANNGDPDSFLGFTVSQYDNYSYLFSEPFYIVLGQTSVPTPFALKGLRIGVNGKVPTVGQAFATLDMTVDDTSYNAETGAPISSRGMIVGLEHGADIDQFFLSFEQLGNDNNVFVEATYDAPVFTGSGLEYSEIGLRNFSEIRESFAQVTTIDSSTAAVQQTYDLVVQQLPSSEDILGFLSAHQMGVTQLAIAYCGEMIDTKAARDAMGITLDEINGNVADEHNKPVADWDAEFVDPMLNAALNSNLLVQPDLATAKSLVHHLLFTDADGIAEIDAVNNPTPDGLARCSGPGCSGNTALAAKAGCAAVLGSSAVTLQ
ncbi:MAG: LamG domain-containing protein [Pseudomonadales bacterium]|nr:LamG domain-containing protein [Gammaproteobacteria bacterium]NNL57003.1 LamG domain-containing protein [Pseudomonadales bacterium]